jgi:gliding motility-associated protein GldM
MAGGNLSPRQKMINLMYLVLTALLALNVSKQVLDAFKVVNDGIINSTNAVIEKVDLINQALIKEAEGNPDIGGPLLKYSEEVNAIVKDLVDFIEDTKHFIVIKSGGYINEATEVGQGDYPKNVSNYDGSSRYLGETVDPESRGLLLKDKINQAREALLAVIAEVDPDQLDNFKSNLTLEANDNEKYGEKDPKRRWEYHTFYKVPVAGTVTILDKFINDAFNAQASVNGFLLSRVGAVQVKIDKLAAQVMAASSYLPSGGKYESKIFLAASSSNLNGRVFLGKVDQSKFEKDEAGNWLPYVGTGESDIPVSNPVELEMSGGMAMYTPGGSASGKYSYEGIIQIPKPGMVGKFDNYPFFSEYEIAAPAGFSVSAEKMNVLYIGLENPIRIAIGDAKPGSISASMTNGSLTPSGQGGSYIAKPTAPGEATITARGTNSAGGSVGGEAKFRVMRVPDPVPTLGGTLKGGKIQKGPIAAQSGLVALLENFAFDARFNVLSYDFILSTKGEILSVRDVKGPMLDSQVKNLLNRAQPKDYVLFDNIRVAGPDGTNRKLATLAFEII